MTAVASAAPAVVKARRRPKCVSQPAAERPVRAEQQQQHVADGDRRQHQRQVHEGIEQRAPGKAHAREHPGDEYRQRQAEEHAAGRDRHAQAQRLQFRGSQERAHSGDGRRGVGITARTVARGACRRPEPLKALSDECGLEQFARGWRQWRCAGRETLLLEPVAIEEARLVLGAAVAQHGDDGVSGAELARDAHRGGDVDAAGAAEKQPFLPQQPVDERTVSASSTCSASSIGASFRFAVMRPMPMPSVIEPEPVAASVPVRM